MAVWTQPTYPVADLDIEVEFDYVREYARSHYPGVPYARLTTTAAELDDVHREIDYSQRTYATAILLYGFVTQAPDNEQPTTKYGIDWDRDIVLHVPTIVLSDASLATLDSHLDMTNVLVGQGDRFRFHAYDYEVLNAKPSEGRYQNTDIPMYWLMQAKRLRPDSADAISWDMDP